MPSVNGTGSSVSVIIPTYNRADLLPRALNSVLPQCEPGDEVIVVDDGSTDGTDRVVERFGAQVRYLKLEHRGVHHTRNAGIRAATGDLVAFLDDDDEWMTGKLSWQRTIMRQFPEILLLFSDFGHVGRAGEQEFHQLTSWHTDRRPWEEILGPAVDSTSIPGMPSSAPPFKLHMGDIYPGLIFHFYVCQSTLVVRRAAAGDALAYPEDLVRLGDYECFARLARKGLAGYMDCDTQWNHGHSGSRLTGLDPVITADVLITITKRVWGADEEYLRRHGEDYRRALDLRRRQKIRPLLAQGRNAEAARELDQMADRPLPYSLLTLLPGGLMSRAAAARRRLRSR